MAMGIIGGAAHFEDPSEKHAVSVTVTPIDLLRKTHTMSKVVFGPSFLSPSPVPSVSHISRQSGMSPTTWARHVLLQIKQPPFLTAAAQDQLIDVFKSVGQVVGFRCVSDQRTGPLCRRSLTHLSPPRLVFDRETGKPKGYGFCEFAGTYHTSRQSIPSLSDSPPCLINPLLKTMTPQCLLSAI